MNPLFAVIIAFGLSVLSPITARAGDLKSRLETSAKELYQLQQALSNTGYRGEPLSDSDRAQILTNAQSTLQRAIIAIAEAPIDNSVLEANQHIARSMGRFEHFYNHTDNSPTSLWKNILRLSTATTTGALGSLFMYTMFNGYWQDTILRTSSDTSLLALTAGTTTALAFAASGISGLMFSNWLNVTSTLVREKIQNKLFLSKARLVHTYILLHTYAQTLTNTGVDLKNFNLDLMSFTQSLGEQLGTSPTAQILCQIDLLPYHKVILPTPNGAQ